MKISNVSITSLNKAGDHFALGCEYKGDRYHIWCNANFHIDKTAGGGDNGTLFKNPPADVKYKGPGYFSPRHLRADSFASLEMISTMIRLAKQNNLLALAREEQAKEKAAEDAKREVAMLEHRKEKLGPEMFTLLSRLREDGPNFSQLGNYWKMDINEILDKVKA
jgi:hypothetical protein